MDFQVPSRAFFAYAFACGYRDSPTIDGDLRDWDRTYLVPDLMALEGRHPFADFYMAWNERALYFALDVRGKTQYRVDARRFSEADCLEIWIDTRDVRDARRASRYCHQFYFLPKGGGPRGEDPIAAQVRIARAREHSPICDPRQIETAVRVSEMGYTMEMALPAGCLSGYDPDECVRLGFTYYLNDVQLGAQHWSGGKDQPISFDPSTWGVAELVK